MRVEFHENAFSGASATMTPERAFSITELLYHPDVDMPEKFSNFVVVEIAGHVIERKNWAKVKIKPDADCILTITPIPQGRGFTSILATIATIAAVASIGVFGVPFLGIAAGTLGASVAAAGVGIVGQLASRALSAPPSVSNDQGAAGQQKVNAGFAPNAPVLNDMLPVIFGKVGYSPPPLMPPYTVLVNDDTYVVAVVGHEGRCLVENILINGLTTDQFPGIQIEYREGAPYEAPRTIGLDTVIEQRPGITLSSFSTLQKTFGADPIISQPPLDVDIPQWHGLKTDGDADDFTVRFLASSGLVDTGTPANLVTVPVRMRIRLKGDVAWRYMPELALQDLTKGSKPARWEAKFLFSADVPGGPLIGQDSTKPIWSATNVAAKGTAYEYQSDAYFQGPSVNALLAGSSPGWINNFDATGATTSGMTVSSSSVNGAHPAWNAFDGVSHNSTYWQSATSGLSQWLQVQFSSAKTIRSYLMAGILSSLTLDNTAPSVWNFQGSNNGVDWTNLDDEPVDLTYNPSQYNYCNVQHPGAYTYYRWTFTKNVGGASSVAIAYVQLFSVAAGTAAFDAQAPSTSTGLFTYHSADTNLNRGQNLTLTDAGITFYLDPAQWTSGEYEVQIMRGLALPSSDFSPRTYSLPDASSLFDYVLSGGVYVAGYSVYYRSDLQIETFQTHEAVPPFDPTGLCFIALMIPNTQINSVYAEFTRYAPIFSGGIWTDTPSGEVPTSNPAALYRQLMLGGANATPLPGEVLDEDEIQSWYANCVANGYECNAVMQGSRLQEAKQLIASAGYGSPRDAALYGVVQDGDTSGALSTMAITPMNSHDLGSTIAIAKVPHAIIANFSDATDHYMPGSVTVYREGYDATNATLFEAVNYLGWTDETKTAARARYDLRAAHIRQQRYSREVGLVGHRLKRGSVVKLVDDVLDHNQSYGRIVSIQKSGGNITGVTLDNIIPWSLSTDFAGVEDVTALTDVLNPTQAMGLCFEHDPDNEHTVSNVTDSNVVTFATPFADDPEIIERMMVVTGNLTNIGRRAVVMSWVPSGHETFKIELADEANELFTA